MIVVMLAVSCSNDNVEPGNAGHELFSGARAFDHLTDQVSFGPRVPGSSASAECRTYFYQHFSKLGFVVDSQRFSFFDPYSQTEIDLTNVIISVDGSSDDVDRILFMAHYDCRPRGERSADPTKRDLPIDGANDGASGVAVLMELATVLSEHPPSGPIDLVLVDGEDWGKPGDLDYYMLGSQEFARRGIRDLYSFGIVVDMVGDASQEIYREGFSETHNRPLNNMVWQMAANLGISSFRDSIKYSIRDDHLSLIVAGVPAIDLIDFDYPWWHTENDTPDKCSPSSLANVGRVLLEVVNKPSLWPRY